MPGASDGKSILHFKMRGGKYIYGIGIGST